MTKERLRILLEKYENGKCTPEELHEIDQFYDKIGGEDKPSLPDYMTENWDRFADSELKHLKKVLKEQTPTPLTFWRQPLKIAAGLVGLIGLAFLSLYIYKESFSHVKQLPAVIAYEAESTTESNSRYVLLPDSSIVILHAGSILKMDSGTFNQKERDIELTGEAYFDIKHNASKPFIVHTGKAKITVLGTAFNVKSDNSQIEVTVTRGKVMVEEGKSKNILIPNQQVIYTSQNSGKVNTVNADEKAGWIKAGLVFNDERMDSIVNNLEARYKIDIKLNNKAIAHCRVLAGSPFSGTESAEEILSLICPAINATYKKEGNSIIIDGVGCDVQ